MNLVKQKLTLDQERKVQDDLRLITSLTRIGRENGLRVIISGGYAVDGFLGEITRYHNDIDIQIYGIKENAEEVVGRLLDSISPASGWEYAAEDKGRREYYHNLLYKFRNSTLDIYYLQTKTNPLGKEKFIVRSDGSVDHQKFGEPKYGKIGSVEFEIQDPTWELKDKIYKREERGDPKRPEHEQDIKNLQNILRIRKGIVGTSNVMNLDEIIAFLKKIKSDKAVLVAIEGYGGSGKSTLAEKLEQQLPNTMVIEIDSFIFKEKAQDAKPWEEVFDRKRLENQVLEPASSGHTVSYQRLDWANNIFGPSVNLPQIEYLIIDGISSFHPDIERYYNVKIWVNTPIDIAKQRGQLRDKDNENFVLWEKWVKSDLAYQQKYNPEQRADILFINEGKVIDNFKKGKVGILRFHSG